MAHDMRRNRAGLASRWLGLAAVAMAVCVASCVEVTRRGGQWIVEGPVLRVSVNEATGTWEVLDKRCGRLWRQPAHVARERLVMPIRTLGGTVQVDGNLADWLAGGEVVVDSKLAADSKTTSGDLDSSARFRLAWDGAGWWVAAEVTDDNLVGYAPPANLWDVDSIELWLGEEHWGFAPKGDGVEIVCWSNAAMAKGCRAATKRTPTGWTLEAFVPWDGIAAMKGKPQAGARMPLAFGLNDADGKPGRQCQLFYPPAYKHRAFETHAMAELSGANAPTQAHMEKISPADVVVKGIRSLLPGAEGVEIKLEYSRGGNSALPLTVRLTLSPSGDDLLCEIAGDPQAAIHDIALPDPLILDEPEGVLVIPQQSGLLFGVDEIAFDGKPLGTTFPSMPWFGATDMATGQGYLAIFETRDDASFRGAKVKGDGRDALSVRPIFQPQKGKFGYPRRLLYHFSAQGGYVALAKRYRAYAKEKGLLKTLAEKRKERPAIDRLVGAVNIYTNHFAVMEEAKRIGIERALVSGFSGGRVRTINDWGYLTTRYDIYTDLYEPGSPPSQWERCEGFKFPEDVVKRADGSNQVGWCPIPNPKTGKPDPSYVICWTCGLRTLRQKMPKRLSESPFLAYFLDCVTASGPYECYDPAHPLTRTEDRETRLRQLGYLSGELGLVVGSESGRDWAVPVADYFEGIMGTATYFAFPPDMHELPFEIIESTPNYDEFGLNPKRRVPLFQLVYGDCAETTWWWGDNNHRMPPLWGQKDLQHMIHATMPLWVVWDPQQGLFWGNTDRFKECYDNVCQWRRAVGYFEMTNHEHLSTDRMVQRSTFANGASVTVNFAKETRRLADGTELPPRSYLIRGDAAKLAGLPVGRPVQVNDDWRPRPFALSGNTGFEQPPCTWSAADGMEIQVQGAVTHSGSKAACIKGTQGKGWSYAWGMKGPLQPGRKCLIRGWLRVDALSDPKSAPKFKCGVTKGKEWLTNFFTPAYDLSKMGTWQKLETTFTAPEGATHGALALEKGGTDPATATLYVDDVELTPLP